MNRPVPAVVSCPRSFNGRLTDRYCGCEVSSHGSLTEAQLEHRRRVGFGGSAGRHDVPIPLPITKIEGSYAGVEQRVDIATCFVHTVAAKRVVGETTELVQQHKRQETTIDPSGIGEEPEYGSELVGVEEPAQTRGQVRGVDAETLERFEIEGRLEHGEQVACRYEVVMRVRVTRTFGVLSSVELFGGVLADGLEEPVATRGRSVTVFHQRLRDERTQPIDRVELLEAGVGRDRGRGREIEVADEHREPLQQLLLDGIEERIGPVDGRFEALVAFGRIAAPTRQQPEPLVESSQDLRRRHHRCTRRCELDRERVPVKVRTQLSDRGCVLRGHRERPACIAGSRREQHARLGFLHRDRRTIDGQLQRRQRMDPLTINRERFSARGQHREPRRLLTHRATNLATALTRCSQLSSTNNSCL